MGRKLIDLTGQRFTRLTVVEYLGRDGHSSFWRCVCDCGVAINVHASGLRSGNSKSCGCYRRDRMATLTLKHGERSRSGPTSPEYKAWDSMHDRCYNPRNKDFQHYGGRGISVCDEWRSSFESFLLEIGRRPSKAHSVDRIDTNSGYQPGNVRWATWGEQARNRRNNRIVFFRGRECVLIEAAELAGIPYKTVKGRLRNGWSVDDALNKPVNAAKRDAQRNTRKTKSAIA